MKQKGFVPILILVGLLIVVTIGGYFAYSNYSNSRSVTQSPSPSLVITSQTSQTTSQTTSNPSPNPSPSVTLVKESDETANWKTYTNTEIGYVIKYPADRKLVVLEDKRGGVMIGFPRSDISVSISVADNPTQLTIRAWAEKVFQETSSVIQPPFSLFAEFKPKQVASVSGVEMVTRWKNDGSISTDIIFVPTPNQEKMLSIQVTSLEGDDVLEKIFSTFRFD